MSKRKINVSTLAQTLSDPIERAREGHLNCLGLRADSVTTQLCGDDREQRTSLYYTTAKIRLRNSRVMSDDGEVAVPMDIECSSSS